MLFDCCSILSDLLKGNSIEYPYGGVAQLGEHLPCKQGVMGSIPIISTSGENRKRVKRNEIHRKTYMGS